MLSWADPQRPEPAPGRPGSSPGDRHAASTGDAAVASGQHGRGLARNVGYRHQRDVCGPRPAGESRHILLARPVPRVAVSRELTAAMPTGLGDRDERWPGLSRHEHRRLCPRLAGMPAGRAAVPAIREDEWRPRWRAGDHDRLPRQLSLVLGCVSQRWVMLCCRLRRSSSAAIPTAHSSEATRAESSQARVSFI